MANIVGQRAPDVAVQALMPGGEFKEMSLADYQGKWLVVFFYPLDFTFVCPTEIQSFGEKFGEFQKLGAEVLAASTDSVYSHLAWVEGRLGRMPFPLIGDTSHELSRGFDVLKEGAGVALRATFVIDPSGTIVASYVNDLNVGRSVDEIVRLVAAFQSGELTACGWNPGEKTLGKAG